MLCLTTYTILSNLGAAICIPLLFPLISTQAHEGFWDEFTLIMGKVFPMIVLPLILAQFIRLFIKPVHRFIVTYLKGVSFYLWAFTLTTVLGKFIGHLEGQRISAGQGLGQKNMVFGIWVTSTYLSPAASIAPGCYMLWQNVVNSWQIYYRETRHLTYTDKM